MGEKKSDRMVPLSGLSMKAMEKTEASSRDMYGMNQWDTVRWILLLKFLPSIMSGITAAVPDIIAPKASPVIA